MSDLYSMLAGTTGNEIDYLAQDPFYMAGRNLSQVQQPKYKSNWEAILGPTLQGLVSGGLMGYGEQSANQAAYTDARANPFLAALSPRQDALGGAAGPLTQEQSMMPDYSSALAPEDWSPKQAKSDLTLALIGAQNRAEQELKNQEFRQKLAESLDPEIVAAKAKAAGLEASAKKTGELTAEADALGYNPKVEDATDALRKEFKGTPEAVNFVTVEKAAKALSGALKDKSAPSDQELVRYAILMIEPGMAVREGEAKAVANSQSIPDEWRGSLAKALSGGTALGDEAREGIKRLAARAYDAQRDQFNRSLDFYKEQAKIKNVDPERVSPVGMPKTSDEVFGASTKVPPGMRLQRNKVTGETRLVPQ